MTADEIRGVAKAFTEQADSKTDSPTARLTALELGSRIYTVTMLAEIAAQLSELNAKLGAFSEGQSLNVDVHL